MIVTDVQQAYRLEAPNIYSRVTLGPQVVRGSHRSPSFQAQPGQSTYTDPGDFAPGASIHPSSTMWETCFREGAVIWGCFTAMY